MDKYTLLKQYYGYDTFREGQEMLIDSILAGRDTFGIMPTGAGKSICYQIPALLSRGITIVVSPLISLMKDQVNSLSQMGIRAAYLNSSLTLRQYSAALSNAVKGIYKIIYVAPERLETDDFIEFACHSDISAVAIDEAHCVSQWGQDFRPSYLNISSFISRLPQRPVIAAFTATATKEVRDDVVRMLRLNNPAVLVTGFDRKNLYFEVRERVDKEKYSEVSEYISKHPLDTGIIYASTRKHVENICEKLCSDGISATRYHAGLSDEERSANQDDFIYDRARIIVATNAFGMGIDKSNVRFVIHYNMPKNIESYYQEAGRAGRDGEPSDCILLWCPQDIILAKHMIERSRYENQLSSAESELVLSRDRARLNNMAEYCSGAVCLRAYMMKYFGEDAKASCANCSVCCGEYIELDITEEAKKIIGGIASLGQRYGIQLVCDVLRGIRTARIVSLGINENSYYGCMANYKSEKIRKLISALMADGYIVSSGGEYPTVFLSEKAELFDKITVRISAESMEHGISLSNKGKTQRKTEEDGLFELLRKLRSEISLDENIPPYMVFSDKTLHDMCIKMPKNSDEMLSVSGVGSMKNNRYGDRFLSAIYDFNMPMDRTVKKSASKGGMSSKKFLISEADIPRILLTEQPVGVNEIAARVNQFIDRSKSCSASGVIINKWLIENGFLSVSSNSSLKNITDKGRESGIFAEHRTNPNGMAFDMILLRIYMQNIIINSINDIMNMR